MPVAMISTSTSPALGPSRSISTISSGCLGAKATAARVFIVQSPIGLRRLCLEEAPYPTGYAIIVVWRIKRRDRRFRIGHDIVAFLDQRLLEPGREFRMEPQGDARS